LSKRDKALKGPKLGPFPDEPYIPASYTGARARRALIEHIKTILEQNGGDSSRVFRAYKAYFKPRTLHEYIEIARMLMEDKEGA
jgi:hypothetical protein